MIQSALHRLGYHIGKHDLIRSHWLRLAKALESYGSTTVFDIGANCGQFAMSLRDYGFSGKIVSFEPLPEAHRQLTAAASADESWIVPPAVALGDSEGHLNIHVSANSVASSALHLTTEAQQLCPDFSSDSSIVVPCATLDSLADHYLDSEDVLFIKLDVQGYEPRIIAGATKTLSRAVGIQVELSLVPFYEGQPTYGQMLDCLRSRGFSLWGVDPVFADPRTGRLLEVDGLFFRD